jgi:hypothetical protein
MYAIASSPNLRSLPILVAIDCRSRLHLEEISRLNNHFPTGAFET